MADNSDLQKIQASEKPTSDDFEYAYVETVNKAFVRIAKERLKEILGANRYTNEEIDQKLSTIPKFNIEVVSSLPTTDISETTIYLVSSGDDSENLYTEYININGLWEILGTQKSTFSGSAKDVTYDDTETKLGATNVQDAFGQLSATINNLPSTGGSGLTNAQINLLDAIGNYIPFKSAEGGAKWDELIASLRGGSSGGEEPDTPTEATLSSISATYNGGEVTTGTELSSLTGITVTATYSDGTTKTVTGYTLSGEILEGENTITVTYGGKTTTFTVTGIVESGGGDVTAELITDGLVDYFDLRTAEYNNAGSGGSTIIQPTQGNGQLYTWANNVVTSQNDNGITLTRNLMHSTDKTTNQADWGTEFTIIALTKEDVFSGDFGVARINIAPSWCFRAKYNTTTSIVETDNKGSGNGDSIADYNFQATRVNGNVMKVIFDTSSVEFDGTSYDGFVAWKSKSSSIGTLFKEGHFVALAIYNRALTDVEIEEMRAFFKTLEVA